MPGQQEDGKHDIVMHDEEVMIRLDSLWVVSSAFAGKPYPDSGTTSGTTAFWLRPSSDYSCTVAPAWVDMVYNLHGLQHVASMLFLDSLPS